MIKAIWASDSRFQRIEFKPGFNVVFADRSTKSSDKDSRNGTGKSTTIEIIHFCLGAQYSALKTLSDVELEDWTFSLLITLDGHDVVVSRNTKMYPRVTLSGGWKKLPILQKYIDSKDETKDELIVAISEWTTILGILMFNLDQPSDTAPQLKYKPSFRSLISYFARRGVSSYTDPFHHFAQQTECDKQMCNAFLLGLPWQFASKFQIIKDREKQLTQLKKAVEAGLIPGLQHARVGELEAKKVELLRIVKRKQDQLDTFSVNDDYHEIQKQSNVLTDELHTLIEQNMEEERLRSFYAKSLTEEVEPSTKDLIQVYEEANVHFPDLVKKRFDDVNSFHKQLIVNRKQFLKTEITRLKSDIESRDRIISNLTEERAKLMRILRTERALEEHIELQRQLTEQISKLHAIEKQIDDINDLQRGKSALREESERLYQVTQNDFIERRSQREIAIDFFGEASEALYDEPGKLLIEVAKTGYRFAIDMERSASQGIGYMKVFCYDMTLVQLWTGTPSGPGFLVHDSTIFDGVDERQIANALRFAHEKTVEKKFQYICMLNTDAIPWDLLSGKLELEKFERRRFTDEDESTGVLGFRLSSKSTISVDSPETSEPEAPALLPV